MPVSYMAPDLWEALRHLQTEGGNCACPRLVPLTSHVGSGVSGLLSRLQPS